MMVISSHLPEDHGAVGSHPGRRQGKIIEEMSIDEATEQKICRGSLVVRTISRSPEWTTERNLSANAECARRLSPSLLVVGFVLRILILE